MTILLPATDAGIAAAAGMLRSGALVGFGTETVYGLGADATNPISVAAIYQAKGRPSFNPLIIHYPNRADAGADVIWNEAAEALALAFWPGPLTLVLPRRPESRLAAAIGAGLSSVAVRVPGHPIARHLLEAAGGPVAAPSANLSGRISPTTAAHVMEGLGGRIAAVLDCGPCVVGLESTVVDLCDAPRLLRPGGITRAAIEAVIGPLGDKVSGEIRSPGQLAGHYAPHLPLRLNALEYDGQEALLAFGPPPPGTGPVFQLSEIQDMSEAAARLFAGLRWLDAEAQRQGRCGMAAMPIPEAGLGAAINDRLARAAHR